MRARELFFGFAAGAAIIIGAVGAGCGGSSDVTPTPDASADVTVDHAVAVDASVDTAMDTAVVCAVDADITSFSLDAGADGGACIACFQSHCASVISRCNKDCDCKSAFLDFYSCTAMGGTFINCAISSLSGLDQSYQSDLQACAPACAGTCGISLGDAGREGGRDAASDAPDDGG